MDDVRAEGNDGAGLDRVFTEHVGRDGLALEHPRGRIETERLFDDHLRVLERPHVLEDGVAITEHTSRLFTHAALDVGMLGEKAESPREEIRRRLVTGEEERHRLVAHLRAALATLPGQRFERPDGSIAFSYVGSSDDEFLVHGAVALVAGHAIGETGSTLQQVVLDMKSGRASAEALPGSIEFPRIDPRRVGRPARFVTSTANWKRYPGRTGALFHGVQVCDLTTGNADRFDYGERMVVEEHIVVPRPHANGERDAWLVGTTFDAKRKVSMVNVIDAKHVGDGPIAQATLPYWLPLGFHGSFTSA